MRHLLELAGRLGQRLNMPVYVVGGFVRDLLLDRPNHDVDFVVEGEGVAFARALAAELGGAVGASRAAIDLGLKPKEKQVGQSGVTVAAKLYVACGISGAVQHIVGMEHSDVIIGINKDANAPIFNVCKYGFVGDAHQILPRIIEQVKKNK